MKHTEAVITADGVLHATQRAAFSHASKRYNDHMTVLRRALTDYMGSVLEAGKALAWVEENFAAISVAAQLQSDLDLSDESDVE